MFNRKEKPSILERFFTIVACFVLGVFVLVNSNFIQGTAEAEVFPLMMNSVYASKQTNENINVEFRKMMLKYPDIQSVILYKFVQDSGTSIYTGQVNITSETHDGSKIPEDSYVNPMMDSTNSIQDILLNKINYENVATIQLLCEDRFSSSQLFSCERYKKIGTTYKSVISIPIIQNVNVGVIGYVMVTLGSEYDNLQVQDLVNGLQPNITSVQLLVN
jgi:hypothetical protein